MITLYVKTHNKTGLKYFGKTTQENVESYPGSGLYWKRHIKMHGNDVSTEVIGTFDDENECERAAIEFSIYNDIVASEGWANLREENGKDGKPKGAPGHVFTDEQRKKISESTTLRWQSGDFRCKVLAARRIAIDRTPGGVLTERAKLSWEKRDRKKHGLQVAAKWRDGAYTAATEASKLPKSQEHKNAIAFALKGVAKSEAHKDSLAFSRLPEKVRSNYADMESFRKSVMSAVKAGTAAKSLAELHGISLSHAYRLIKQYKE